MLQLPWQWKSEATGRWARRVATLVLGFALALPAGAGAQTPPQDKGDQSAAKKAAADQDAATDAEGKDGYQGVTPAGGDPPIVKAPPPGKQYVTWPGFQMSEGNAEVFLQLTGPVTYTHTVKGRKVTVVLDDVLASHENNLRPVITRAFPNSPVARFRLRPQKKDKMRLEITLSRRVIPTISTRTVGTYTFLIVSLPVKK